MAFVVFFLALLCSEYSFGNPMRSTSSKNKKEDLSIDQKFKVLQRNFDKLYNKLEATNADLQATNARVVGLHLTNDKLKNQISLLESSLKASGETDSSHSAFLALHTGGTAISTNEVIHFEKVSYNDAPKYFGFDPISSFYRCPYNGTYMFLTNVVTQNVAWGSGMTVEPVTVGVSIMKQGLNVVSSQVTTPQSSQYGSSQVLSAAGVTLCGPGDEVGVVMTYCGSPRGCMLNANGYGQTHFTGFRIY